MKNPILGGLPLASPVLLYRQLIGGAAQEAESLSSQEVPGLSGGNHPSEVEQEVPLHCCSLFVVSKRLPIKLKTSVNLGMYPHTFISFTCLLSGGETP